MLVVPPQSLPFVLAHSSSSALAWEAPPENCLRSYWSTYSLPAVSSHEQSQYWPSSHSHVWARMEMGVEDDYGQSTI